MRSMDRLACLAPLIHCSSRALHRQARRSSCTQQPIRGRRCSARCEPQNFRPTRLKFQVAGIDVPPATATHQHLPLQHHNPFTLPVAPRAPAIRCDVLIIACPPRKTTPWFGQDRTACRHQAADITDAAAIHRLDRRHHHLELSSRLPFPPDTPT
jgi:hypothetical protein